MDAHILIIIMIFLIVGETAIQYLLKRYYRKKILACLSEEAFDGVDRILNKNIVKFIFTPFNLEYCKLNEAFLQKNKKKIDCQFDALLKMKLNEVQKQDVCLNGFNYYLSENNKKRVEIFYNLSKELKNEVVKNNICISYDILCKDGYKYLDEILEVYKNCSDEEKYINEFLLSIMYKNKGDLEKSSYFEQLANQHKDELALR